MREIKQNWSDFKSNVDDRGLGVQWYVENSNYVILAFDGPLTFKTEIYKEATAVDPSDQKDFEDNYKAAGNANVSQIVEIPTDKPIRQYALNEGGPLRARLVGILGVSATKNDTTDHDYKIPQLTYQTVNKASYMDGIQYYAKDAVVGDKITFQVVDVDNILGYGANTVLDEFGKNWYVMPDKEVTIRLYKASLIKDLYIRLKYTSTGTVLDVDMVCNLFRHMDTE